MASYESRRESLTADGRLAQPLPQVAGAMAQVLLTDGRRVLVEAVARENIELGDIIYDAELQLLWLTIETPRGLALGRADAPSFHIPLAQGWGPSLLLRVTRVGQ